MDNVISFKRKKKEQEKNKTESLDLEEVIEINKKKQEKIEKQRKYLNSRRLKEYRIKA